MTLFQVVSWVGIIAVMFVGLAVMLAAGLVVYSYLIKAVADAYGVTVEVRRAIKKRNS